MSTSEKLKEQTQRKLSKRQRKATKSKATKSKLIKLQSKNVKKKRVKMPSKGKKIDDANAVKSQKTAAVKILTESNRKQKSPNTDHTKENVKQRKKSTGSQKLIKGAKKSGVAKSASKGKTPQAVTSTLENVSSQPISPLEEGELDVNWKKLSKTLGFDHSKKKVDKSKENVKEEKSKQPEDVSKDLWFDDVEEIFIEQPPQEVDGNKDNMEETSSVNSLIKPGTKAVLTKCLAMDCEMVGVGPTANESVLARISVVNQYGHSVYDKFVKPLEEVTDYRTWVSGVRPEDLEHAEDLEMVQKEVNEMFKGRILVGHAIGNDEKVLFMNHPKKYVRDTQKYPGFRNLVGGRKPSLKMLSQKVLGVKIQSGEHSSVQDAQATMRLYTMVRDKWEKSINEKHRLNKHHREKMSRKKSKQQEGKV